MNQPAGPSGNVDGKSLVLGATDIVELVSQTVKLKRSGAKYVGLCPFHQEKSPSFYVDPTRQFFKCFGCNKGGNAIDFVIERDRVDFKEALRSLAERAGVELPRMGQTKEKASERQILLEAQSMACSFFEKTLASPAGEGARKYLADRGFTPEMIQRFQIGFAPDAWDGLLRSPLAKKFAPPQLALAGLAKPRDGGNGYYDAFRNRVMFPIRDEAGRIIAFGGRVAPGSTDRAKYLNSPETPLFSKSRCAFGIDLARPRIVEKRSVAVVEGYTDVVMAHQYGVSNVVSVLGTALTEQHVNLLRRFADRIVLLFDADAAGDTAADRAVQLLLTQPVDIAIASMPEGLDPDEYLLRHGAAGFEKLLDDAPDALAFKWKQLRGKWRDNDDLTGQQQAVEQYLQTLGAARASGVVDAIRWGMVLGRVSRLTDIPVEELNKRFRARPAAGRPPQRPGDGRGIGASGTSPPASKRPRIALAADRAEMGILGVLLAEPERWTAVQSLVGPEVFVDPSRRRLAEIYWQHQRDEGEPVFNEFLGLLDDELKDVAIRCMDAATQSSDLNTVLDGALEHLRDERRRIEDRQLLARLRRNLSDDDGTLSTTLTGPSNPDGEDSAQVEPDGPLGAAPSAGATGGSDEIEVLRMLQERARRPDLRRFGA